MTGRRRDLVSPLDLVDVLVDVVVLNLAVQFVPSVITETFTLSLLTAVLLKVVLEVVVAGKGFVVSRLREATTPLGKAAGAVARCGWSPSAASSSCSSWSPWSSGARSSWAGSCRSRS
jgi:hypothetical protein